MLVVAERWIDVTAHWIEAHPARIIGASGSVITAGMIAVDSLSPATIVNAALLTFTLSGVTLITRVMLVLLRSERARTREMAAQLAAHSAQLVDDNHELRARVAELERRLMGDGR